MENTKKGLIIGKFEVVHKGHVELFTRVSERKDIGSVIAAITSNKRNIFTWEERKSMVEAVTKNLGKPFVFYDVSDINNMPMYSEHVRRIIGLPSLDDVILFTGNPYTANCFQDKCEIENVEINYPCSATRVLEMIGADDSRWQTHVPEGTIRFLYRGDNVERIKKSFMASPEKSYFPRLATDIIIEYQGGIVLIERKNPPYGLAMPGGYHKSGLSAEKNAAKEAKEETNLDISIKYLLGFYSEPERDVRDHTASAVYVAAVKEESDALKAGDDAKDAKVYKENDIPWDKLAFDHADILKDYYFKKEYHEKMIDTIRRDGGVYI
jgi:ADP-ribose pyrophosphatase YjhB (NUDIX family)/nicotinamide mononucleotide adenylyltransferase